MKKLFALFLTAALLFSAAACGANTGAGNSSDSSQEDDGTRVPFTGAYVVDAAYVKEHMGEEGVLLVDARGEDAAAKGTVEGAIAVIWQMFADVSSGVSGDPMWGTILPVEQLSEQLSATGISPDKEIILFAAAQNGWGDDGRILWELVAAGFPNVKMVDGGYDAPLAAVLLAAWQGAFLPWQPCRTVIAAAAVLGKPLAVLLCLAGQLLACGFWYFLSRGLVSPFFTGDGKAGRRRPAAWYAAAAGLFVPGWAAPLSAIPGALGARARTAVPLLALAALPRLALTACLCSQMSAALPFPWSWVSPGAGCIAVLTSVWGRRAHARRR